MVLTASDAFDGQKFHRVIGSPLHECYSRQQANQIIYVGLLYRQRAQLAKKHF